jgi:thiopeptide-type bacteriocin biosynthesis protein
MKTAPVWLSGHIAVEGNAYGRPGDEVLLDVVDRFFAECAGAGWIDRYFFIRYFEGGPHIRVRVRGDAEILDEHVAPLLSRRAGSALRWVPYQPETERYGGTEGLELAECLFQESTRAALLITRNIDGDRSARLGKVLLSMIVFVYVFTRKPQNAYLYSRDYARNYLRTVAREEDAARPLTSAFDVGYSRQAELLSAVILDAWERLEENAGIFPALDDYRLALEETRSRLESLLGAGRLATMAGPVTNMWQAIHWIGASYLHMMNNRLGASVPEEAYLAHLIARTLDSPAVHPSALAT